jgi:hypothetical protein
VNYYIFVNNCGKHWIGISGGEDLQGGQGPHRTVEPEEEGDITVETI